jgi:hypothetical protein
MRHLGQVDRHGRAADILAQRQRQAVDALETVRTQQLAEIDARALRVGQFDADHVAAWDHGHARGDGAQADHARGFGAGRGLQLVKSDHRARPHLQDLALHAEIGQHGFQQTRVLGQRVLIYFLAGRFLGRLKQIVGRQFAVVAVEDHGGLFGLGLGLTHLGRFGLGRDLRLVVLVVVIVEAGQGARDGDPGTIGRRTLFRAAKRAAQLAGQGCEARAAAAQQAEGEAREGQHAGGDAAACPGQLHAAEAERLHEREHGQRQ